ncbi:MAG TPA: GAF domain-containing protein [Aggregatilineaceae bacterium]|nr:GAF domain-containing protein [Aggregatilineaceae bacterium]
MRKFNLPIRPILLVMLALFLIIAAVQTVQTLNGRDGLVEAERQRSLALASSVDVENAPALEKLVAQNEDVDFIAIITADGDVLAHSDPAYQSQHITELANLPVGETIRRDVPGFGTVYLTSRPSNHSAMPGAVISVGAAAEPIDQRLERGILFSIVAALGGMLLVGGLVLVYIRNTVSIPARQLREGARILGEGNLDHRISAAGSPELQDLTAALNEMADALKQSQAELQSRYQNAERRVEERTRDLEISSEIGRVATRLHDADLVMQETLEQIRRRFKLIYHAQVFLVDDVRQYAILVKSTGEAGQKLLQFQHKLPVGSDSVIGYVTAEGKTLIASNTRKGEVPWQPNPLLPETRAEMALPLVIEGRVTGALDVQSKEPDVFTPDMVRLFEVLAGQLAIAIENARLLAESQRRVSEIDDLNRQLTRSTWRTYIEEERSQNAPGYQYDLHTVQPLNEGVKPLSANHTEVSIQVRGEHIGTLIAAASEGNTLLDEDRILAEAVAERVALAVENARLFHETQQALAETEQLYETARAVSSVSELVEIYQLIVDQLSTPSYVDWIEVLLSGPDPTFAQYLESAYSWSQQRGLFNERLPILPLTYSPDDLLPVDVPIIYADVTREMQPEHPLYASLAQGDVRSCILVPLNAGVRWFGMLVCGSRRTRVFEAGYVTFASALADQLTIAIENRRLFDEAQSEARRARALAEAGQLASQIGGGYESGLQNLFEAVAGPGHYDRWWFGTFSQNYSRLERVTASSEQFPAIVDVGDDLNALAEAARISEIVLVNDSVDHPVVSELAPEETRIWGKHLAVPVKIANKVVGVLLIGRSTEDPNLDERDIQLAATLASQVAVATENRRLYAQAESQRQNLQTIVNTMPTGVLVMDQTGSIVLSNYALEQLLGPQMKPGVSEEPQPYPVVHTNTNKPYALNDWPLAKVFQLGEPVLVDDMTIVQPGGIEVNILASAAPIYDSDGQVAAVVGAFQDITELQALEHALQNSLRETTMLYEASRSISRAANMEQLLQATLAQVAALSPDQTLILLNSETGRGFPEVDLAAAYPDTLPIKNYLRPLEPLFSADVVSVEKTKASAELEGALDALHLATLISFPLRVRGQVNGWIWIGYTAAHELAPEQRRLMITLADQAAVTIENQRLFFRTQEALQDTATLYQASRAIANAQTPMDILQVFLNFAAPQSVAHAALYLMVAGKEDENTITSVQVAAVWGNQSSSFANQRYPVEQFAFWDYVRSTEATALDDVSQISNRNALQTFDFLGVHAAAFVPLKVTGRLLGAILIGLPEIWKHEETEIRIYESLSDQAAIALENARLYQQTQRRARQLATAAEISGAVTSILQLDELLSQVVNLIRDSFDYDHTQVFLVDGENAKLVASTGEIGRQLLERQHFLPVGSQSVIGQVTATGKPQIALDTADARVVHRPNPLLPHTRSEMALPLIAHGQILGALDVQSNQPAAFNDEDTRVLSSLADLVATAIDNARLFEVSEQRAEEMSFLFNVTTAATRSPDLNESLQQVVQTLRESMDVSNASVFLPDEVGQYMIKGADTGEAGTETVPSTLDVDRGLVGWVARNSEPVIIGDLEADPRRLPVESAARSVIAIPLVAAGNLAGVLVAESDRLNAFNENDLQLLQTLSGSLAAIVQNSRLLSEVQAANERLLEVDRLKTNFLAAMSHELRTPLNSIIGFSRVILKEIDGPLTEMQEQDLNTIYESGKHLLGLVNDILDQAKIEAGKMELSFGFFKVQDVIHGVMSTAIGLTRDKPLKLHTELDEKLPDAYGDEFRTRQVLLNLVSNASKFTPEGTIRVSAFPVVEQGREFIQVSVADTGIGIAEKDMPLLFEAFQQIDNSTTRTAEGTGLGLPLAKSLCELQGGRIWVESQPHVGSTFSFTVPLAPEEKPGEKDVIDDSEFEDLPEEVPAATRKILVVEDDAGMIDLYRRYLARDGYDVVGVTRPEDAEEMVVIHQPLMVLLDVNMPNRDGWMVLEGLKQLRDTFDTPVVVCSIDNHVERGLQLGALDYLVKPFTEEQLLQTVHQIELKANCPKILLVDDQPDSIRLFREALESSGQYHVLVATDGQQAIEILRRSQQIGLVILDLRMPDVDGFQVLEALRSNPSTAYIPVLVLTADEISSEERDILDAIDIYRKDMVDEQVLLDQISARLGERLK